MGLVDYSESESEGEGASPPPRAAPKPAPAPAPATTATANNAKKPFQKIVNRANPGKILVNLPSSSAAADDAATSSEEPPAKRAKIGAASGGGRFSNFGAFLPAPKTKAPAAVAAAPSSLGSGGEGGKPAPPRPGVHLNLKTSAEAAFSREVASDNYQGGGSGEGEGGRSALNLPPPAADKKGPSIPEGQLPAAEVKLVGQPLMFKPLSVARKPARDKKKKLNKGLAGAAPATSAPAPASSSKTTTAAADAEQPPPKKVSLFSLGEDDEPPATAPTADSGNSGAYEPLFAGVPTAGEEEEGESSEYIGSYDEYTNYAPAPPPPPPQQHQPHSQPQPQSQSLDAIANDLNLSAAARRELFGRGDRGAGRNSGSPLPSALASTSATKIVNFNMDAEYQHNEELRAAAAAAAAEGEGGPQQHNPVRALQPGKHSLRQLVTAVQSQRDALEESFAKNRATQREASGRYGWR